MATKKKTTKKKATKKTMDITVVLDRSGSMGAIQSDAEGGLQQFVKDQKEVQGDSLFTLAQFDGEYEVVYDAVPLKEVGDIKLEPRGCTALLDAMGKTINSTSKRLDDMKASKRPSKVLFVVVTDGLENASQEFKRQQVFDLIKKHDKWQFVFLAANQDAIAEGASYGFDAGSSMTYSHTGQGVTRGMNSLSSATMAYASSDTATVDAFFSDKDREAQDELLEDENNDN